MQTQTETMAPPLVMAPGVGVGPAVAPSCYLVQRRRRDLEYKGLVDPVNERVTVKQMRFRDARLFTADVLRAARAHEVGKVLLYAREEDWLALLSQGFVLEAVLDGYFHGRPAYLMGYLLTTARRACGDLGREQAVVESALSADPEAAPDLPDGLRVVTATTAMAPELAAIYRDIFTSFPSPLHEPEFVAQLIDSGEGIFRAVLDGSRIASAAAAEMDREWGAAEITNCATLPEFRGEGLMQILISDLEEDAEKQGATTLFSIARASSFGMNRALGKAGYRFRGCLRGNSHIMGGYEDMHLWVKSRFDLLEREGAGIDGIEAK